MRDGIDLLCEALVAVGIDHVFGVPGTQNVALFEGFRRHRVRTVLATHELAASFMANGFYRATGRVAALATIPGPGFTYALTGLAEARLDSVALLYLVGKPAAGPGRTFQLQAIDQPSIAGPLIKGCLEIASAADAGPVIREAYALATAGEPGPVMVQLDMRVLGEAVDRAPEAPSGGVAVSTPARGELDALARMFAGAARPVFYLGAGAFGCADRLERLAVSLRIPVLTTPTARGIVAEDSDVAMGFDPLRGHVEEANMLLERADLVVALGCKLGHNGSAGFALRFPAHTLVHVDASPEVPGANYDARLAIAARVEEAMSPLESRSSATRWGAEELAARRAALRRLEDDAHWPVIAGTEPLTPARFFDALQQLLPRDAIVVTDSGRHQILVRRHLEVTGPRQLIVPSDLQSMGFGLPAAIGARLATNRPVVAIIGDGGFQMSGLELLTSRREGAPLVAFVFNNGYLDQIRVQQWREFGHAHAVGLLNPDFETLSKALGIGYVRFDASGMSALQDTLASGVTTLVEVVLSDTAAMLAVPVVARAKNVARAVVPRGLRHWLRSGLGRRES